MPRSYTSDPAAGRRFGVGVQTQANRGVLGFGLTPEEAQARRAQALAQEMGLAPELQAVAGQFAPDQVKKLGLQSILGKQDEDQRQAQEERQFGRHLELRRQEEAKAAQERAAQIDMLIKAHKGQKMLGSPVEWEARVRANPEYAERELYQVETGARTAAQRAADEAAKRNQQIQSAKAIVQGGGFDPAEEDELMSAAEAMEPSQFKYHVGLKRREFAERKKETDKEARSAAQHQRNLRAFPPAERQAYEDAYARIGDPDKAAAEMRANMVARAKEAKEERFKERQSREDELKRTKELVDVTMGQLAALRKESEESTDPARVDEIAAQAATLRAMGNRAVDAYMALLEEKQGEQTVTGSAEPSAQTGFAEPTPAAPGAGVSPAGGAPPPAAPPQAERAPKDYSQALANAVRPETVRRVASIASRIKDPAITYQLKEVLKQILESGRADADELVGLVLDEAQKHATLDLMVD